MKQVKKLISNLRSNWPRVYFNVSFIGGEIKINKRDEKLSKIKLESRTNKKNKISRFDAIFNPKIKTKK